MTYQQESNLRILENRECWKSRREQAANRATYKQFLEAWSRSSESATRREPVADRELWLPFPLWILCAIALVVLMVLLWSMPEMKMRMEGWQ